MLLAAAMAGGLVLRIALSAHVAPSADSEYFRRAGLLFREHGLTLYGHLREPHGYALHPDPALSTGYHYPPGLLPWWAAISHVTGRSFWVLVRLPAIAADLLIACAVLNQLTRTGRSDSRRVWALVLIMFGPAFLAVVDGGQIDGLAVFPAFVGAMLWSRGYGGAVRSGVAVGVGAVLKTVPGIFILPLIMVARPGKRFRLAAAVAVVVLLSVLPFVLAEPAGTFRALRYTGAPGGGGLSLLVQPGFASHFVGDFRFPLSSIGSTLQTSALPLFCLGLATGLIVARRRRLDTVEACAVLAASALVLSVNFYLQYLLWFLPFAIAAGHLGWAVALQVPAATYLVAIDGIPKLGALHARVQDAGLAPALMYVSSVAMTALLLAYVVRAATRPQAAPDVVPHSARSLA